jgi:two-component system cell cycle response regulator CtrA
MHMRVLLVGPGGKLASEAAGMLDVRCFSVDPAPTGEEGLQRARADGYDAIAFDVTLPDMAGLEFVRRLRLARCATPAVALVRVLSARERAKLLDTGADDVVALPCEPEEFAARVRAVGRRARGFTQSVLRCGPVELHMDSRLAQVNGQDLRLSPTEFRVLQLLLLRKGALVTKTALMDALYNDPDEPEIKSIDVLMHRLRKRLAVGGAGALISTVWGAGYIVRDPAVSVSIADTAIHLNGAALAVH